MSRKFRRIGKDDQQSLWDFCEHCGLHRLAHSRDEDCMHVTFELRFKPLSDRPEWCLICFKHIRHHYGMEGEGKPPRCQPRQETEEERWERLRPMPCPEHGVCLQDPCQPRPVESSAMNPHIHATTCAKANDHSLRCNCHLSSNYGDSAVTFVNPTFSTTMMVSSTPIQKGIVNYPIATSQDSRGVIAYGNSFSPAVSGSINLTKIDPVNPKHYRGDLVMRIIEHFGLEENFYLGNVIKYILRHAQKAGIEDLKKARWYLDRMIERAEGKHQEGVK